MSETGYTPIPAELITAISRAYSDTDNTLARRVAVIRRATKAGFTVKRIAEDMASAAAFDPSITAKKADVYGFAAAAGDVLDTLELTPGNVDPAFAALLARTVNHVRIGNFRTLIRETLSPIADADTAAKIDAVTKVCAAALDAPRADRVKAREPRPNMGTGDTDAADIPNNEDAHPAPIKGKPDAAETLAALRRATKYLTQGGTVDADMASAISEFVAAAAAASRRTKVAA